MASHARNLLFWQRHQSTYKPNSVILITGAGSGIGRQLALTYARRPCRLALADVNTAALEQSKQACLAISPALPILLLTVDVTTLTACQSMVATTLSQYGQLDILVLCAGIGAHHTFSSSTPPALFDKLLAVNFYGYLHCTLAAFDALKASHGLLVAITSFSGEVGLPYRTAYCASKFAVTGFLEALRSEMTVVDDEQRQRDGGGGGSGSGRFDIVIVCPPTVNTNLRRNSLTPDPQLKDATPPATAMSVEQCAEAIVDAADRRLRKAFFPLGSWMAAYFRPIIPDVMDALILKRAKL